jgi:hypothetical protein
MVMKKILSILIVVCFSTALFAQTIVSTTPSNKNVILEEFTGKSCPWCPDGHKTAQQIMANNPERAWAINIHQGGFATGTPNYTTVWGNALAAQYGVNSYPAATVSRGATWSSNRSQWVSWANAILAQSSCLNVAAKGTLDWTTRKLNLLVEIYYTGNAGQSTNKLNVAMLQNEILGPQSDQSPSLNPDMWVNGQYRHMHMLRDFITGQWGEDVTPTTAGTFKSFIFEYEISIDFNNIYVNLSNVEFLVYVAEDHKTIITGSLAEITPVNPCYTIKATVLQGGAITPEGYSFYLPGAEPEYVFTPNPGFEVRYVTVDGESIGAPEGNKYTFPPLDKDHTISVVYKRSTGIEDVNGTLISVAPNPITDQLFVTGMYDHLEIFDIAGRIFAVAQNQPTVDVSRLAQGIYFVKIESNGQTATFKVVK